VGLGGQGGWQRGAALVHLRPADEAVGRAGDQKDAERQARAPVDAPIANQDISCPVDHSLDEPLRTGDTDVASVESREARPRAGIAVVDRPRAQLVHAV